MMIAYEREDKEGDDEHTVDQRHSRIHVSQVSVSQLDLCGTFYTQFKVKIETLR